MVFTQLILAIYGPMINAAPYAMLLMRANGRGLGPGNRDFFGAKCGKFFLLHCTPPPPHQV
jgi:hypothetical protein